MMGLMIWCLTLCWLHSAWSADVLQTPLIVLPQIGQSVSLNCSHADSNFLTKFWYRMKDGKMDRIGYSYNAGKADMEKEFPQNKMEMVPDTPQKTTLQIYTVSHEDSATYYCASSLTTSTVYFGSGTVVTVLGAKEEIKPPKVSIYLPSKQEVEDHNFISLVCVASDFFPEHVNITWFVDGVERVNLYKPVPQKKTDASGGSSYSTSKRLTLTRSEYFNPDSTFQCQAAFLDGSNMTSAEVKGETDCSISKETYTIHINQGKISYIMILCKSGLYALVVLALLWRKKVIFNSY